MISITDGLRCYYNSNMKEKTPLELERENRILQSNWNSLREWLKENEDKISYMEDVIYKMDELEGVDNENNGIKH